jgi:general stress protein YciG
MRAEKSISGRGFASMKPEKQREIACKGGKNMPSEERSFSESRDLASHPGRKGGQAAGSSRE